MSNTKDDRIIDLLEQQDPGRFDEFMSLVGERLEELMPKLRKIIRSYGSNFDHDEVLSQALERSVTYLWHQYAGKETSFRFSRDAGVCELDAWVLCIVGKPGAKRRSGVVGAAIQRRKRNYKRLESIDEHCEQLADHSETTECQDINETVSKGIATLLPREQFVLRLELGLHDKIELTAKTITEIATSSGIAASEAKKIRRRSASLRLDEGHRREALTQNDIALLLDIGARQIRNLKAAGLETLRGHPAFEEVYSLVA